MFKKKRIIAVVLIIAALFSLFWFLGKPIKNFFHSVFAPIEKFFWQTGQGLSYLMAGFLNSAEIKQDNKNLLEQNIALIKQVSFLKTLEQENYILKQALQAGIESQFNLLLADVVSQTIYNDSLLINKGTRENIEPGQAVVTSQAVLVGRVGQVWLDFCQVDLISQKDFSFDAAVQSAGGEILSAVRGQGGGKIALTLLPKDRFIGKGDPVITSALGANFPAGLLVGKVSQIKQSGAEPFVQASLEPFFQPNELSRLFIITNFRPVFEE